MDLLAIIVLRGLSESVLRTEAVVYTVAKLEEALSSKFPGADLCSAPTRLDVFARSTRKSFTKTTNSSEDLIRGRRLDRKPAKLQMWDSLDISCTAPGGWRFKSTLRADRCFSRTRVLKTDVWIRSMPSAKITSDKPT